MAATTAPARPSDDSPAADPPADDPSADWARRSDLVVNRLGYVLLPVTAGLATALSDRSAPQRLLTLAVAAAAGLWMLVSYSRPPGAWRHHALRPAVYFVGLLVLCTVLMQREPIFFLFTIVAFLHAFVLQPRVVALVGVAATSVLINVVPGGVDLGSPEALVTVAALVALQTTAIFGFTVVGTRVAEQSEERRRTVGELERALEENAALHEQLLVQAHEAGALDERQRMAREIHDTLAQGLIGIVTQLEAADEAEHDPATRRRHVTAAATLARDSLTEARRSVHALGPQPLEDASLGEALRDVVGQWSRLHGVRAELVTTGDATRLHPEVEGTLLRTAQEALANVARHAAATRVGLTLSYMGDVVSLDVRDDGVGFDVDEALARTPEARRSAGGGFGLTAMRQRVRRLAGTLDVESEPGTGTALSASVPAVPMEARGG